MSKASAEGRAKLSQSRFGTFRERGEQIKRSFSGHERNRLFINKAGKDFVDATGVSGMGSQADGRVCVRFDLDRDGWSDVAVINANRPVLELYHNRIGQEENASGNFIAIRFVGGNDQAAASEDYSNRSGYGAKVRVKAGNLQLLREHRCGEGMAAQNSATMLIGLGDSPQADEIRIQWPSGLESRLDGVAAGSLVTVYEDIVKSPSGDFFVEEPYTKSVKPNWDDAKIEARLADFDSLVEPLGKDDTRFYVFTTMATWCEACHANAPQVKYLRDNLQGEGVRFVGLPVDEKDTAEKLQQYEKRFQPPYKLLPPLNGEALSSVQKLLESRMPVVALPSTIVTDAEGRILHVASSALSLSKVLRLISTRP